MSRVPCYLLAIASNARYGSYASEQCYILNNRYTSKRGF